MFKRFTLLLCLIASVLLLPTNLLANESWQPKRDLINALIMLSDEDIQNEFPKLVMKEERENYALLMAQLLIYRYNEITKGEAFLKIANVELARKGNIDGSISTNTLKMVVAIKNSDNTSIIEYGKKVLSQMKKSDGISHSKIFKIMMSLSDAYYTIGDYDNSLKIAKELLTIIEGSSDKKLKAETYFSISESSYKLSQHDNAENAGEEAYELYFHLKDNKGLGHAKKALGNVYLGRGELKKAQESYTLAITYYKKIKDNHGLANCYFNLGLILKKSNSWEQSIDVFELASFHYMESGSSGGAGMAKMEIGQSFTKLKKFESAQLTFKESRGLLTKTNKLSRLKQLTSYENALNIAMMNYERTNWLSPEALKEWLSNKNKEKFWDLGFWIINVEGKATETSDVYRVTTDKSPTDKYYWWHWWYGQSDSDFENHKARLEADGFEMINGSLFTSVSGQIKRNGVWHKTK